MSSETSNLESQTERPSRSLERQSRLAAELGESLARLREALRDTEEILEAERSRADDAEERIQEIYDSTTWRVGHVLLWIPKQVKSLIRR